MGGGGDPFGPETSTRWASSAGRCPGQRAPFFPLWFAHVRVGEPVDAEILVPLHSLALCSSVSRKMALNTGQGASSDLTGGWRQASALQQREPAGLSTGSGGVGVTE